MTGREFLKAPGMRYALGVFVLALATTGWATVNAYKVDIGAKAPTVSPLSKVGLVPPPPVSPVDVGALIVTDPFSPTRVAPKKRYRLPGDTDATPKPVTPTASPREPPRPTVLGTVVSKDSARSFATVSLGPTVGKLLHIGQKIGDFTIVSIELKKVVFVNGAGQSIEVLTNK